MSNELFSIRMRASRFGRHVSGAERIIPRDQIDRISSELRDRAQSRTPEPDRIVITIESLAECKLLEYPVLPCMAHSRQDVGAARLQAIDALEKAGVARVIAQKALFLLDQGASPSGTVMRGAVIMTAEEGKRLEPDQERGIRVSRVDWTEEASSDATQKLAEAGLGHFRTKEALALATKVAHAPGVIAELCWSDDPEYTAGYVASRDMGYMRFPMLKAQGQLTGGRIFFVREEGFDIQKCMNYLEQQPVLISGTVTISRKNSI